MADTIIYEHPLNERIRLFLRLEHFFNQTTHFERGGHPLDTQAAITAFIEILGIVERAETRTEILKELDRQISVLSKLLNSPSIDNYRLDNTLRKLTKQFFHIQQRPKLIDNLFQNIELLNILRQRLSSNALSLDTPSYQFFLNQSARTRSEIFNEWVLNVAPLKESIALLVSVIRNSGTFNPQESEAGFCQIILDTQFPVQLVRIGLSSELLIFPEISGSKHRLSIRFLNGNGKRFQQITHTQPFSLSLCTI